MCLQSIHSRMNRGLILYESFKCPKRCTSLSLTLHCMAPPTPLLSPNMNRKSENAKAWREDAIFLDSLQHYIAYLLRILGYTRIWPIESFSLLKMLLLTGTTIIFISALFLLLLAEILMLTMNINLKLFASVIGVISLHCTALTKWCYCIWKNRKIVDLVMKLEKCHVLCQRIDKSDEGHRIYRNEMEHARKYSNLFTWWWGVSCIYGVLHWSVNPFFLGMAPDQINSINRTLKKRIFPYIAWYPVNIDDTYNYACLYLMQVLAAISSALGTLCYDAFYVTMLIVICMQLQYINAIIPIKINFDNVPCSETTFILEDKLKKCVDCHTEILKFLKMLQTFTGPAMFLQCVDTLSILCLISFEASVIKIAIDIESIMKLLALLEYFLLSAFELFAFCFCATQIEYLGLQIAHSVYSCRWELVDLKKKTYVVSGKQIKHCNIGRTVQIIMMQAQRPIVLTGGPFYVLSMETFRVIMSVAMSNSLMLRTMASK
ncbi:putative odorant receptor 85e isoform X2 [Temnothorax longispinosus]|uniref:putative odorant receptor 85e isoform X2 n=1 Tax=Temnothorax longispinosus TaxID=300112 RepID=UPI003A9A5A1A